MDRPEVGLFHEQRQPPHPGENLPRVRFSDRIFLQETLMLGVILVVARSKRLVRVRIVRVVVKGVQFVVAHDRPCPAGIHELADDPDDSAVLRPPVDEVAEEQDPAPRLRMRPGRAASLPAEILQRDPQLLGLAMDVRYDVGNWHVVVPDPLRGRSWPVFSPWPSLRQMLA
jgi:hypothetical protein